MTLNWFPWQPPTTDSLRQFSLKSLLPFSNLPTIVHMEMKLCAHVYSIVSMTTISKKFPQALFPITTSSLLKLANHAMHGSETWYTCISVFPWQPLTKIALGTFPNNYFFTSQTCTPYNAWRWNLVRMCISAFPWQPLTKNGLRHFSYNYFFTSQTCKPCNAWKWTWYACVFQRFHDNHEQKRPQALFDQERLHFSNLQAMKCIEVKLCRRVHFNVTMTTINEKWPWAPFSIP